MALYNLGDKVNVKGLSFTISRSSRKNKQRKACSKNFCVHYGDPKMKEFPLTKRGNNYCSRSLGIANKFDIKNNPKSANFWSRLDLWHCKGSKSVLKKK